MPETLHEDVDVRCADGYVLRARYFRPGAPQTGIGRVAIVAPATGVAGRYYWRFAGYLAAHGFGVLVPDYRGIGRSAPRGAREYRRLRVRWHEWGTKDIEACILWLRSRHPAPTPIAAVGHSFGGFATILAEHAVELDRLMMVGAQHAHWPDYDKNQRLRLVAKWHLAMPVVAAVVGYFPGRRLGWLEDLPRGVAYDWARGAADYSTTIGPLGHRIFSRAAQLTLPVLAVNPTDDPYATPSAVRRTLAYLPLAETATVFLEPDTLGVVEIGHFGLFHSRFRDTFWRQALDWLAAHDETKRALPQSGSAPRRTRLSG